MKNYFVHQSIEEYVRDGFAIYVCAGRYRFTLFPNSLTLTLRPIYVQTRMCHFHVRTVQPYYQITINIVKRESAYLSQYFQFQEFSTKYSTKHVYFIIPASLRNSNTLALQPRFCLDVTALWDEITNTARRREHPTFLRFQRKFTTRILDPTALL